jgi:hypothetical protein
MGFHLILSRLSSRSGRSRSGERSFGGSCCGSSYVSSEESCDTSNTKYRVVMLGINYKIQFYYCKIDFKIEIV